jgi:hypothetical protein
MTLFERSLQMMIQALVGDFVSHLCATGTKNKVNINAEVETGGDTDNLNGRAGISRPCKNGQLEYEVVTNLVFEN